MHSVREATSSEINPVAVTRLVKVLEDVGKDVVKAKVKVRKVPEARLQAPRASMPPRLRLLYIN